MEIRIKRVAEGAKLPTYAHVSDAGADLYAASRSADEFGNIVYGTGIAVEIPQGYVGLVFPRSSIYKKPLHLTNCVGVIDSGYRGEIMLKYKPTVNYVPHLWNKLRAFFGYDAKVIGLNLGDYEVGDRVGQLVVVPFEHIIWQETDFLYPSDRGDGGYGSTGD